MSKRLQVLLDEQELRLLQETAKRNGLSLSAWVRRSLDAARAREPGADLASKVAAIRAAAGHAFPTSDIDQMLEEIDQGYRRRPPQ